MRYSKQRELVMQQVEALQDHPTAEEIYENAVKQCPGLSLGTVYRNLNSLVEAGRIRRVPIPGQADRFDHTLRWHSHLYCTECGEVSDVMLDGTMLQGLLKDQQAEIKDCVMTLLGRYPRCVGAAEQKAAPVQPEE